MHFAHRLTKANVLKGIHSEGVLSPRSARDQFGTLCPDRIASGRHCHFERSTLITHASQCTDLLNEELDCAHGLS